MGGAERYKPDLTRGRCFGATARYGEDGSGRQDASLLLESVAVPAKHHSGTVH